MVAFTRQLTVILKHIILWCIELEEYAFLFFCDLCTALLPGWQYSHPPITRHSHSVALAWSLASQPMAADFPSKCMNWWETAVFHWELTLCHLQSLERIEVLEPLSLCQTENWSAGFKGLWEIQVWGPKNYSTMCASFPLQAWTASNFQICFSLNYLSSKRLDAAARDLHDIQHKLSEHVNKSRQMSHKLIAVASWAVQDQMS